MGVQKGEGGWVTFTDRGSGCFGGGGVFVCVWGGEKPCWSDKGSCVACQLRGGKIRRANKGKGGK